MSADLTYAAIGATRDIGVPEGFRLLDRSARLGTGMAEFQAASAATLDWQIQRLSGMQVVRGGPIPPRQSAAPARRVSVGDRVTLRIPFGPLRVSAAAEVVYVIDEPRRAGFAYGTLRGHPESGEEAFIVELRDDDSVWLRIRAFSRPSSWFWRLGYPVLRLTQEFYTRRYLAVLASA